ncbi:MAG: GTP cyclohydrolase I FolE, partial [Actinomycetales bacterium]|nr:GTP cyclohydrolase I FolE [Actinomycetales bacterium]
MPMPGDGAGPPPFDAGSPPFDADRVERAVREILVAIGEDPDRDGLKETP